MRRGKRQEARGNSKGIGGDSANLKNKCFKCVLGYQLSVISYQLSVISYQLSVISYQLSVIS
ncbi:hypothetical protein [Microcystis sp. BLCC-F209]|uniref:hypothetical protein n=1 Tax=Microcystis sp. BLCC-F209 TaxID=3342750 RepID=UPI0035B6C8D1